MTIEYEYTFEIFPRKKILKILNKLQASKKGTYLFIVTELYDPEKPNLYLRVRDEGYRKTMTVKSGLNKDFPKETEIEINDFKEAVELFKNLGYKIKCEYEKIREIWELKDGMTHICFDIVPGKPERMEIESGNLETLNMVTKTFELDPKSSVTKNENQIYFNMFGINLPKDIGLTFNNARKNLSPLVTKNKEQFDKLISIQEDYYNRIVQRKI